MPGTRTSLLLLALFAISGATACTKSADGTAADAPADDPVMSLKGKPAPDFTLKTLDGKELKLSAQKGKVVLVDTWATWCPPCRASLPHIQSVSADKSQADKGLLVWAIDDKESKDTVEKFLTDNKYSFTVLMDDNGDMLTDYQISGIPTTLVVGRDGTVREVVVGYDGEATAKQLDAAIDNALAEPAPG